MVSDENIRLKTRIQSMAHEIQKNEASLEQVL